MSDQFRELPFLFRRVVLTDVGPEGVQRGPGEPKPLRPQARRLQSQANSHMLRYRYLTAQICLVLSLGILLSMRLLPLSNELLDMSVMRIFLYALALASMFAGLIQAFMMQRSRFSFEVI